MRVYKREEFLKLPPGTVYAKGKQWFFDGLNIKADSLGNDWVCLDPMWIDARNEADQWDRLEAMLNQGASYPMHESYGRDGCFDDDAIFLVLERADLEKLRSMIDAAIAVSK